MATDRRARHYWLGAAIFLGGLLLAAGIYLRAEQAAQQALDDPSLGPGYTLSPEHSKKFLHDLEVYGGKANVLMYKFRLWVEDLFSGKSLACLVAVTAALASLAVIFLGGQAPAGEPGGQDEDDRQPRAGPRD